MVSADLCKCSALSKFFFLLIGWISFKWSSAISLSRIRAIVWWRCAKNIFIYHKKSHEHNTRLLESCSKCCSGRRRPLIASKGNSSQLCSSWVITRGWYLRCQGQSVHVFQQLPTLSQILVVQRYIVSINPTSRIILQAILFCDASYRKNPCNLHWHNKHTQAVHGQSQPKKEHVTSAK